MRALIASVLVLQGAVVAAAPRHAALETRPVGASLEATVSELSRRGGTTWIAWAVPAVPGHRLCCSWHDRGCTLDDAGFSSQNASGGGDLHVFVKAEAGRVARVRPLSASCDVDARGAAVVRLEGVTPQQSVRWLAGQATQDPRVRRVAEDALAAVAFHADGAADEALERLSAASSARELRKKAAFWLGIARGERGFQVLARLVSDPDPDFREELAFAISRSDAPAALDTLIRMARRDEHPEVRSKAIFWLGQVAGERARAAIDDAVDNDPETEVKTHAVFALSQLPPDEGVPALIRVAETHRNPRVREKAMFWLGQTGDPRALDWFEKVLTR